MRLLEDQPHVVDEVKTMSSIRERSRLLLFCAGLKSPAGLMERALAFNGLKPPGLIDRALFGAPSPDDLRGAISSKQ